MHSKLLTLTILIFLFGGFSVRAQVADSLGMSVSPEMYDLSGFQGESLDRKITLKNLSDVPIPISVKVVDFTASDETGGMEFDEIVQDPSITSRKWFEIENQNLILESRERRDINFRIEIPENAEPGGHYSVMLFEPQLPAYYFRSGQPKTIPIVGVLFFISVQTLSLEPANHITPIEIVDFKIPVGEKLLNIEKVLAGIFQIIPGVAAADINIVENQPTSFSLRIKNNDIYHHKLDGNVSIYNSFGDKVGETEITKTTILPQKIREFPITISQKIPDFLEWLPAFISNFFVQNTSFGKYHAVLNLGEGKSDVELNATIDFWAFPWKIWISVLSFVILTVLMRRRLFAATKILFKK